VTVSAAGFPATDVALSVGVCGWVLPDIQDFRQKNFGQISPDSLARYYNVPPWSDKHMVLIEKSMALMAEVNSRQVLLDLTIGFYSGNKGAVGSGNEESMVRWVKKNQGVGFQVSGSQEQGVISTPDTRHLTPETYSYDFTAFDKMLDTAARAIGKPFPLRLNCWVEWRAKETREMREANTTAVKGWCTASKVTAVDPATGKLGQLDQPPADSPEFLAFWKPVLDEARKKIAARGWFDVTTVGHNSYCYPPDAVVVDAYKKIWPDGVWSYTAHNGTMDPNGKFFQGTDKSVSMPIRNADCVWSAPKFAVDGYSRLLKPQKGFWCFTYRGTMAFCQIEEIRNIPEGELQRGLDGWSDFGVDFFPLKDSNGRWYFVENGRGTGGPSDGTLALLAPGKDGPVSTERFEMLREGMQVAEAILYLRRAVEEGKLPGDLKQRVTQALDDRARNIMRVWLTGSARVEADCQVLALAGEVAAARK
jgi:hypothetical protein